jgi:hypothetical protein
MAKTTKTVTYTAPALLATDTDTITATSVFDPSISGQCFITIIPPAPMSLQGDYCLDLLESGPSAIISAETSIFVLGAVGPVAWDFYPDDIGLADVFKITKKSQDRATVALGLPSVPNWTIHSLLSYSGLLECSTPTQSASIYITFHFRGSGVLTRCPPPSN